MHPDIPYDRWQPLSLEQVTTLFTGAPFQWAIAGGYALEQFLGRSIRQHDDMDVMVFRDQQNPVQGWLKGWELYAADPPGTLRKWNIGEYLPEAVHDIWCHRTAVQMWEFQFMVAEVDGQEWFSRCSPLIRGKREDLIVIYNGVPCIRVEVQLMYKAKNLRPKDEIDFQACMPHLNGEAKQWLKDALLLLYPDGHRWLNTL